VSAAPAAPAKPAIFHARTIVALVAAGIVGFLLFLLLTAYAGNLRGGGGDPRAHALSRTAIGFHGLVRLIELSGGRTRIVRDEDEHWTEDLLVVTVEERTDPARLAALLERRETLPTLVILPKWLVARDPARPGRVLRVGELRTDELRRLLHEVAPLDFGRAAGRSGSLAGKDALGRLRAPAPDLAQGATGDVLSPLVATGDGAAVLSRIGDEPHYLLSDPDLMNNQGLRSVETAHAALQILTELNSTGAQGIAFDLTLNGFMIERSALKLAFEPPFLPLTVALFVATLLAGLHGAVRFGAAAEAGRAIAFGKSQLVENSAGLFKLARREHGSGGAYAELIREAAANESGAHLALRDAELDAYLDRVSPPERPPFSALAAQARAAGDTSELLAAARALFQWKKDLLK
jgi:hypothetical protein